MPYLYNHRSTAIVETSHFHIQFNTPTNLPIQTFQTDVLSNEGVRWRWYCSVCVRMRFFESDIMTDYINAKNDNVHKTDRQASLHVFTDENKPVNGQALLVMN